MSDQAARIRAARAYADLSRVEMAKRIGVSETTLQRRENGLQPARRLELVAIADVCQVPISFLEDGFAAQRVETALEAMQSERAAMREEMEDIRMFIRDALRMEPGKGRDATVRPGRSSRSSRSRA